MSNLCLICERITKIKNRNNLFFVMELSTGYVVLGDHQFYKGYTLLLAKQHKSELHQLDWNERIAFLKDMSIVAEAVYRAFQPKKLNYELLGNKVDHLHWHIFPRYNNDPLPTSPIWSLDRKVRESAETVPNEFNIIEMRKKLLTELKNLVNTNH